MGWKKIRKLICAAAFLAAAGWSMGSRALAADNGEGQEILYGIGSTSKVVTAAAVMKLSEEGRLSLDEPLVTYLPEFEMADERYQLITPRMLLDHSSGIPGGTLVNAMLLGDSDTYNHDNLLRELKTQRLKADPGEFSVYCNDGFTLAEILVERVSGMSFTEYIRKEFSEPLGLSGFATPQTPGILERTASVYDSQTGKSLPPEMANVIGSGGVYATAEDLCRFSRIFMDDKPDAEILSGESLAEMEKSTYMEQINPGHLDSNLSYGLGWDSVDTYPFSRYGIKALVKGGDTSYYHASLTVLPEENISCALLTSGGASVYNQIAVQEILLAYLEETGRITRQEESTMGEAREQPETWIPEELKEWSGLYSGTEVLSVAVNQDGTLLLKNQGSGKEKSQVYEYHQDGRFYSTNGDYINISGGLSHSTNGLVGKTFLEFCEGKNGEDYLMSGIYQTYPKLGSIASYLPAAERLEPEAADASAVNAWKEQDGRNFYLVSEKYTSALYYSHFRMKALVSENPSGFLSFEDSELRMAKITDKSHARFFQRVPGQVGRDLNDYRIERKDGRTYLVSNSGRYIREDGIEPLEAEQNHVIIGSGGEAVWKSFGEEHKNISLSIDAPEQGAWYLYESSGKTPKCVASSYTQEAGKAFLLPAKGYLVFAGEAEAEFRIIKALEQ